MIFKLRTRIHISARRYLQHPPTPPCSLHPRACADVDEASVVEAALDPDVAVVAAVVAVAAAVVDGARVVIPAWQVETQKPALKRPKETTSIYNVFLLCA